MNCILKALKDPLFYIFITAAWLTACLVTYIFGFGVLGYHVACGVFGFLAGDFYAETKFSNY